MHDHQPSGGDQEGSARQEIQGEKTISCVGQRSSCSWSLTSSRTASSRSCECSTTPTCANWKIASTPVARCVTPSPSISLYFSSSAAVFPAHRPVAAGDRFAFDDAGMRSGAAAAWNRGEKAALTTKEERGRIFELSAGVRSRNNSPRRAALFQAEKEDSHVLL